MVVVDVSIVNVALPQMKIGLHLSATAQQWVVNAYTLAFAGLLGGRAADLFGRRRMFLLGLGLFTGFSLLGGLAQSGAWADRRPRPPGRRRCATGPGDTEPAHDYVLRTS